MSPERIDGQEYSFPSDVWALGLSLMTVALGRLPFNSSGGYWSILQSIRDENIPELPNHFTSDFKSFLRACLHRDPAKRQTCEQLLVLNDVFPITICNLFSFLNNVIFRLYRLSHS